MSNKKNQGGYGKPPKQHQFQKGKSGNPKGRPKGTKNLGTDLQEELSEQVMVTEGGRTRKMSKQRLLLKAQANKGIKGDTRAANLLIELHKQLLPADQGGDRDAPLSMEDLAILDDLERRVLERANGRNISSPAKKRSKKRTRKSSAKKQKQIR